MIRQTKLTDILNLNEFKNCELKPSAAPTESFLSILFSWDTLYKSIMKLVGTFNTYSMKQPDLYYFEIIKNDITSLVKFCIENASRRLGLD